MTGRAHVASTKNTTTDETVLANTPNGDDTGGDTEATANGADTDAGKSGGDTPARTTPVKRGPGTKEVIPFAWKLVGEANGLALTLFKSVERDDVEAQLVRVANEGYYKKLRIMEADARIKQPTAVKTEAALFKGTKTVAAPAKPKAKKASAKVERSTPVIVVASPAKKGAAAKGKAAKKGAKVAKAKKAAKTSKAKKAVKKSAATKTTKKSGKAKKAAKKTTSSKSKSTAKAAKKKKTRKRK